MQLAFCLYRYFPYGGLQRDFYKIAKLCTEQGAQIRVYTLMWRGTVPDWIELIIVPVDAITNHSRYELYSAWVAQHLVQHPVQGVIGFNKMPNLDVYYAADSCYEHKAQTQRHWAYRQTPRYKHFAEYEQAVFGASANTAILTISNPQMSEFKHYYPGCGRRLSKLPPGISRDRVLASNWPQQRRLIREEFGIDQDKILLLAIGSGFIKKGVSRSLKALAALPHKLRDKCYFVIIGEDNPKDILREIKSLNLSHQVEVLTGRSDVPELLAAGDALLHPALDEAAGIILLEAVVSGLPIITTEVCGYASYVEQSGMGAVMASPFQQSYYAECLKQLIGASNRDVLRQRGLGFAEKADIFNLHKKATDYINQVVLSKTEDINKSVAFSIYKYFPFGGLQRDFLNIALLIAGQGIKVRVYTMIWEGEKPDALEIIMVPVSALTNHSRNELFSAWMQRHLQRHPVNTVVGFNKMPGIDFYYAADSCYQNKAVNARSRAYRLSPRYRHFSAYERDVFAATAQTKILMISKKQQPLYERFYQTQAQRFLMLPPGINPDRAYSEDSVAVRKQFRQEFGLQPQHKLTLMIGSGFKTKGLDRSLIALSSLPELVKQDVRLFVIGQDNPRPFLKMVKWLKLEQHVKILPGRDDIPRFLAGADLLIHPAYEETTGTVLLEAAIAGLPVLVSAVCGYAHYIADNNLGAVLSEPFDQEAFNHKLLEMLHSESWQDWHQAGIAFGKTADIYSLHQTAADLISAQINGIQH